MYDDGYRNIENIDISKVCIEQMQEKYKDRSMNCEARRVAPAQPAPRSSPPRPIHCSSVPPMPAPPGAQGARWTRARWSTPTKASMSFWTRARSTASSAARALPPMSPRCATRSPGAISGDRGVWHGWGVCLPSLLPPLTPSLPLDAAACSVLKGTGVYVVISYGIPDNRLSYLDNSEYGWKVDVQTIRACANGHMTHAAALPEAHARTHPPSLSAAKPTVSAAAAADSKDATSVHYVYLCRKGAGEE